VKQRTLFPIPTYCIDSNVFINLKHYPRDIFPTIWTKIEDMIKVGEIISHQEVFKEIKIGKDKIHEWCKQNKKMFKDVDECQIQRIVAIRDKYTKDYWGRNSMKGVWADPWVIALASCEDAIIVTDEKNKSNHIPDIANRINIPCLNRFEFFKKIGIKY